MSGGINPFHMLFESHKINNLFKVFQRKKIIWKEVQTEYVKLHMERNNVERRRKSSATGYVKGK